MLTTPPCSDIVDWMVAMEPIEIAAADIERFTTLIRDERPTGSGSQPPIHPEFAVTLRSGAQARHLGSLLNYRGLGDRRQYAGDARAPGARCRRVQGRVRCRAGSAVTALKAPSAEFCLSKLGLVALPQ